MQLKPPTDSRDIAEKYDEWHRIMPREEGNESPLIHPWHDSVFREIKNYAGGGVLEVGCGRGEFSIWLARKLPSFNIVGLDFSPAAIEIGNEHATAQRAPVEFVHGSAEALPFNDGAFDLVISCECMEHVADPRRMARELARVLKPGGRFCLTTPSQLNGMLIAWAHAWLTRRPYNSGAGVQPRENFFFYWTVRRYLTEAGLSVLRMESSTYQWLLLPRVAPAKLCTRQFRSPWARKVAFPFGLHFSFFGRKPWPGPT